MKVLIPTSGLGTRLGDLTKYTNKGLVKIGDKPVISRIIDLYQQGEFVITLGYLGDYVKQFLTLCYPDRRFEFVYVDPYEGKGSSLLKSISFAKDRLQCPFIFHVCDTILEDYIPTLQNNWMACAVSDKPDVFRTVAVNGERIVRINEKGELDYDYAYLGVAGVVNYEKFWAALENILNNSDSTDLSDCHVFRNIISTTNVNVKVIEDWHDTGGVENLNKTRSFYEQEYQVLDKHEEAIYFIDGFVVKFFNDPELCANRVKRASKLNGLVPTLLDHSRNFYKYQKAEGRLLAHVISECKINELIDWAETNLWIPVDVDKAEFEAKCKNFYLSKTEARIKKYLALNNAIDQEDRINGVVIPSCENILKEVDWKRICANEPVRFHGDFILDNILYNDGSFVLLDWRQDFAGDIEAGDKYYDLSKLNHNIIFNHDIVSSNGYSIEMSDDEVHCDILRRHNMVLCQEALMSKLGSIGYDLKKIRILTCIIWLNMAPLHIYPLNKFLFYFGKYNLWRELCMN